MKKIVALFLCLCLVLPVIPAAAVKPEKAGVGDLPTALTAATLSQHDADCQILRHVDKDVFNAGDHVQRVPGEEELDTYVFRNGDGTKTVYYMDEPVKFLDSDGVAREKDLSLIPVKDGHTTMSNDVGLTLPNDPADGIQLSYNGENVTLFPQGGRLDVEAEMTECSVTYPDYFGEGISLRYTPPCPA